MLTVDTPLGTLRASESDYYDHPGIWIEIQRRGQDDFCPLALVEYTDGEDEKAAFLAFGEQIHLQDNPQKSHRCFRWARSS